RGEAEQAADGLADPLHTGAGRRDALPCHLRNGIPYGGDAVASPLVDGSLSGVFHATQFRRILPQDIASGSTMNVPLKPLYESRLHGLPPLTRGKVRDIYRVDDKHLLIVATDRISAFDVVLPDPIPGKGVLLTALSNFWFDRLRHVVPNHLTGIDPVSVLADP